jgi:hypothetical protein
MVRLLAGLLLALLVVPAQAQERRGCDNQYFFNHSAATGPIEVVPASDQRVYMCGFFFSEKGNTLDFVVLTGQGTNCAVNQTQVFYLSLPNNAVISNRVDTVGQAVADYNYALCIQTVGNVGALAGFIYWSQY